MKRILILILVLLMLLPLTACGDPDPNCGVYTATTASMSGIQLAVEDVYEGGISFELKDGGKAVMTMDGTDYRLQWKLDGDALTIIASDTELKGTLNEGVMTLDMGSGVTLTLVNDSYGK